MMPLCILIDPFSNYSILVAATVVEKQKKSPLRLRGGGETLANPNVDDRSSEIPYLTNSRFMWNGLPCIDFLEKTMGTVWPLLPLRGTAF